MSEPRAGRSAAPPRADGGAGEVLGVALPPLVLDSTAGRVDLPELARDLLVLFIYPHATGLPEAPVPGWESIPGARGCTAQACSFRDHYDGLAALGATVAGLSVQTVAEQRQFAARVGLGYPLLSDSERQLGEALGLRTFSAGARTFYQRLTLVVSGGRIVNVVYPVREPERNAEEVLAWLRGRSR